MLNWQLSLHVNQRRCDRTSCERQAGIMHRKYQPSCTRKKANDKVKSSVPAYLDVHPLHDYEPVGRARDSWVGLYRDTASRQMVHVQQVILPRLDDLQRLAQVAHRHIARPMALYFVQDEAHIAWEYLDLDVLDLPPVSVGEAAAIMAQVSGHCPTTICVVNRPLDTSADHGSRAFPGSESDRVSHPQYQGLGRWYRQVRYVRQPCSPLKRNQANVTCASAGLELRSKRRLHGYEREP